MRNSDDRDPGAAELHIRIHVSWHARVGTRDACALNIMKNLQHSASGTGCAGRYGDQPCMASARLGSQSAATQRRNSS
jgi:hypothetical protein